MSIARFPLMPLASALLALAVCPMAMAQPTPQRSQADIIKQSAASDWRALDPDNTLVMEINGKAVVLELAARFAPRHVANIRTLARNGYYTGSGVVRVQDNYVAQWADPYDEDKTSMKPLPRAQRNTTQSPSRMGVLPPSMESPEARRANWSGLKEPGN